MEPLRDPVNLLYPTEDIRQKLKQRRNDLAALPDTYAADLQLDKLTRYFSPENSQFSMNIFRELCTDPEVINYRLDAVEDLLRFPKLSANLHKTVTTILDNHRDELSDKSAPDTFAALSAKISSLDVFIDSVESFCDYYEKEGKSASSAAFRRVFEYFLDIKASKSFSDLKADMSELKEAFSKKIRCVTVAINFNEEMRPVSAGIVGLSENQATEKPSVFDRIFYRNAKYADVNVKNLHARYMGDSKDPNEIDRKLFEELEKVTSDYMGRLSRALDDYRCIDYREIAVIDEQLSFLDKAAALVETAKSRDIAMCRPVILPMENRELHLKSAFDISFFRSAAAADPYKKGDSLVVGNDIDMDDNARFWLLSGANNGGKTTFVRAVGICQLFAQCGIFVPAAECIISPVDYIYTHFPKEEEVGINSSRFTEEVKDLKKIADSISDNSLLLMNESIQSTTPKECLDIAGEFVRIFTMLGARGIFATHLAELALRMDEINSDPDNRSKIDSIVTTVEESTGERLYKIRRGMPGETSYASVIFDKFGISADEIRRKLHAKI
ncbi:MAG: DNA mismatch repair protein MutS, partial [Oscillospiraceae bacterium]|nr:DNA mismatch repair protein MutS [Oscillospiraceae bacterium]MDY2848617.1 DNA mismatch repair protein MutS [Oscillospiraceae bacterium]